MDPTTYILTLMSDLSFDDKIRMVEDIVKEIYKEYLPLGAHLLPLEFQRFLVLWNRAVEQAVGSWDIDAKKEFKKRPEGETYAQEYRELCKKYATEVEAVLDYQLSMQEDESIAPPDTESLPPDDESVTPPPPEEPRPAKLTFTRYSDTMRVALAPYHDGRQIFPNIVKKSAILDAQPAPYDLTTYWKHYPHCCFVIGSSVFSAHFLSHQAAFAFALGRYTIITHKTGGTLYYFGHYIDGRSFAPYQTKSASEYSTWHGSTSHGSTSHGSTSKSH